QIEFARKMSVDRFLADAQLLRQIVHGHTAKSVTKKVGPRSVDDSLPVRIALSARPRFLCPFHIHPAYHNVETDPVYLVSTNQVPVFQVLPITWAVVSWENPSTKPPVSITHYRWQVTQRHRYQKSWELNRA